MILDIFFAGCGTAGKNFDESLYANVVKGTTTHKEVKDMFGPPFKKGIQNDTPYGPTNITMSTPSAPILSRT